MLESYNVLLYNSIWFFAEYDRELTPIVDAVFDSTLPKFLMTKIVDVTIKQQTFLPIGLVSWLSKWRFMMHNKKINKLVNKLWKPDFLAHLYHYDGNVDILISWTFE